MKTSADNLWAIVKTNSGKESGYYAGRVGLTAFLQWVRQAYPLGCHVDLYEKPFGRKAGSLCVKLFEIHWV